MRPLFIAGTSQHVGKTTTSIGLLHAFRKRGLNVGYTKPLGQRVQKTGDHALHEGVSTAANPPPPILRKSRREICRNTGHTPTWTK